jgi:hypothetical protein
MDNCEDTVTKILPPPKIKIDFTEEETRKVCWEKGISSIAEPNPKPCPAKKAGAAEYLRQLEAHEVPSIPYNKKAEEIMGKKPLRERLSGILPPELQLPISFDHQELLKRMELIDRSIEFLATHRNMRVFYF